MGTARHCLRCGEANDRASSRRRQVTIDHLKDLALIFSVLISLWVLLDKIATVVAARRSLDGGVRGGFGGGGGGAGGRGKSVASSAYPQLCGVPSGFSRCQ
jgi:hypothetical protein